MQIIMNSNKTQTDLKYPEKLLKTIKFGILTNSFVILSENTLKLSTLENDILLIKVDMRGYKIINKNDIKQEIDMMIFESLDALLMRNSPLFLDAFFNQINQKL